MYRKSSRSLKPRTKSTSTSSPRPNCQSQRIKNVPVRATSQRNSSSKGDYKPPTVNSIGVSKYAGNLRLVLLGAAGCGKGSFAKYIAAYYKVPTISTGDILREEIKKQTTLGQRVAEITQRGDLVDDILMMQILEKRLSQPDTSNGYILDGFPRTLPQARELDDLAHDTQNTFTKPNIVLNISLREDVLIAKTLGRRVCSGCPTGYNVAHIVEEQMYMPAILPQKNIDNCDNCDSPLIQRADDNFQTVQNRLAIYKTNSTPLIDYYQEQEKLLTWDVIRGLEDTTKLLNKLDDRLAELGYSANADL